MGHLKVSYININKILIQSCLEKSQISVLEKGHSLENYFRRMADVHIDGMMNGMVKIRMLYADTFIVKY